MHRQHQWQSLRFFEKELSSVKHNSLDFLLSAFQDQTNGPTKKEGPQTKQTYHWVSGRLCITANQL